MNTLEALLVAVALLTLVEVSYLVVKLPRQSRLSGKAILVDTSVLIDGRIVAVATSGFIGGSLVIPRSVIGELQFLADNADHEKRMRARYGLDVVTELQNIPQVVVEILQDGRAEEGVDERLLKLAKKTGASICTIDYNLNKVAVVEGIQVVNVNELAQRLRMAHLPGEKMMLEIVQKGQDSHQGVGYLEDGTMVVVERASQSIGKTLEVEFIRSLQTAAGKMMFARPVEHKEAKQLPRNNKPVGKKQLPPQQVQAQAQPKQDRQRPQEVKSSRPATPQAQAEVPQQPPAPRPKKQQPRRNKRPKDHEATLMDLVDKQD